MISLNNMQAAIKKTTILLKAETDKTFDKYDCINETKAENPVCNVTGTIDGKSVLL